MTDGPRRAVERESLLETNVRGMDPVDGDAVGSRAVSAAAAAARGSRARGFNPDDDDVTYADEADEQAGPSNRWRVIRWVIVVLLALVAAAAAFVVARNAMGPADQAIKPDRFVQEYLEAVPAGDAEEVLSFGPPAPPESPLLTSEMLAVSNNRAPLSDIEVVRSNDTQVEVNYRRGGQPVTGIFDVSKFQGRWVLQTWGVLQVTDADLRMPFVVDGVPLPGPGAYPIFPGSYMITSGTDAIDMDYRVDIADNASNRPLGQVPLTLTESGRREAVTVIQAAIDRCIGELNDGNLQPDNCPMAVNPEASNGGTLIPESVGATLTNDPLDGVEVSTAEGSPVAFAEITIDYTIEADVDRDGEMLRVDDSAQTADTTATVAFDQDPPTVGWAVR